DGLPGIATNLLVERLRSLEENGVVVRGPDGRYLLTPWGEGLHDVVYTLGRWASPLMARPLADDEFRPHRLRHIVVALFGGVGQRVPWVHARMRRSVGGRGSTGRQDHSSPSPRRRDP